MKTQLRLTRIASLVLFCCFSSQAISASLTLPKNIDTLYLNKEKFSFLRFGNKIELNEGQQQLIMRYNKLFDHGSDLSSEPLIVSFSVRAEDELVLQIPHLNNEKQAKAFALAPALEILNNKQEPHAFTLHVLSPYSGYTFNRDILAEVEKWENTKPQASLPEPSDSVKKPIDKIQTNEDTALEMLKFWYLKSNGTTQAQFKLWMEQQ